MKSRKKKQTYEFVDDGRVIANMNIDGMPRSIIRRRAFDEFGMTSEKRETVKHQKGKLERFLWYSSLSCHFAIAVFGSLALFILFCIKVWFR